MKALGCLVRVAAAVVADVVTLGGTVNDGYFRNGRCSYTTAALRWIRARGKWRG